MYTDNDITGEIQLGLSYSESDQTLNVSINKARGLTAPKDDENSTNPYVTMVIYCVLIDSMLCVAYVNTEGGKFTQSPNQNFPALMLLNTVKLLMQNVTSSLPKF